MDKLKPCPFCGGTQDENGVIDHDERCFVTLFADVFLIGNVSKKEIETAWNTRAERTCHLEHVNGIDTCSECGADIDTFRNYCQSCGAKVVDDGGQ